MAIEWYLLKGANTLSGYEDEIGELAGDGFLDALNSNIATDVEILNYDLSECKNVKAIVQNRVQDTKLKTLTRQILVPIGTCKAGMYVKYKGRYWIIVGLVDDNTMYEKAVMSICNYLLTWLNSEGKVVQRWANITSATQYNNGETSTYNYFVRTDQLIIITPDDDECLLLESGKRFIIDRRCRVYEKNLSPSVLQQRKQPVMVYQITRSDSVLYDYQDSGHYEFMAYQDEQREQDGYYIIDKKGYWLCESPDNIDKTSISLCSIVCDSPEIYAGLEATEFTAKFSDSFGNELNVVPQWEIANCDFTDELYIEEVGSSILIYVENEKLINKSFDLVLSGDSQKSTSITVTIKAFF